jgi:hypothetical protein
MQVIEKCRLADTRLASYHKRAAGARADIVEQAIEHAQFALSSEQ